MKKNYQIPVTIVSRKSLLRSSLLVTSGDTGKGDISELEPNPEGGFDADARERKMNVSVLDI